MSGYKFDKKDASNELTHFAWFDAMNELVGGIGGSWTTDRFGKLTLLDYNNPTFWGAVDTTGTLMTSDFIAHTRQRLPEYSKVTVFGTAFEVKGSAAYNRSAVNSDPDSLSSRQPISIKSAISDPFGAEAIAAKIQDARWMIHSFSECRVGMAYDAGDKIVFDEAVDDIPAGAEAYVVEAPACASEPLIVAVAV